MSGKSLVNLGDISKPATVLVERISDAIGGVFRPYQIVRVAKAEAEAERVRAESELEITDLHRRAFRRFLEEEASKQENIEDITRKALPLVEDSASPQDVEKDWLTNFFDKSRIISDDEMQILWSRVLAGEANAPGRFSRRTVNLLGDIEKNDAFLFTRLCGFGWQIGNVVPLVFDVQDETYAKHGISFSSLAHLESLGLVRFDNLTGFRTIGLPQDLVIWYYGRAMQLSLPKAEDNELELGRVLLTKAGQELAQVCGSMPVDGFYEFVEQRWGRKGFLPKK